MQKADHPDFWQSALRSLARRAQSEEMLSAKLKFKGASDASVKQVIAKAKKYQLLDDKAYALMLAEREKGKGRGPLRIMQNLKFHGVKDEAGREALT
ncbi:MAG: regulatory protein RecX, partial [Elusimicrobia bacterium]|nr:regulatory protein RecX [Elusimicrobiota bacterium]